MRANRQWIFINSLVFALLGIVIAYLAFVQPFDQTKLIAPLPILAIYIALLILLSGLLVLGLHWLQAREREITVWLHPPMLITLWIVIVIGVPGLYVFIDPKAIPLASVLRWGDPIYFTVGLFMFFGGTVCLWLGYGLGLVFYRPPTWLYQLTTHKVGLKRVLFFYLLAILIKLYGIASSGIAYGADTSLLGPFAQWLSYLGRASDLMIIIAGLKAFRKEWPSMPFIIMLSINVVLAFLSGFMKPVLWLAITTLMAAYLSKRISWLQIVTWTSLFVILSALIVPIAQGIRSQNGRFNSRNIGSVMRIAGFAFNASWGSDLDASWQLTQNKFLYRQAGIVHTPAQIVALTPSVIPYQGIEQFLVIPAYLIPRAIWPSKPILSQGVWFNINYLKAPTTSNSSNAMSIFGEGYIFTGWLGVIIVGILFGILLAFVYKSTVPTGLLAVMITLIPIFIDVEGQFSTIALGLVQQAVLLLFFYWLVQLPERRQSRYRGRQSEAFRRPFDKNSLTVSSVRIR